MNTWIHSLRFRVLAVIMIVVSLLAGVVLYNGYRVIRGALVENLRITIRQTSSILNIAVAPYVLDAKLETLKTYLQELIVDDGLGQGVIYVIITDEQGHVRLSVGDLQASVPTPDAPELYVSAVDRGAVHVSQNLLMEDNSVGHLQFGLSTRSLLAANQKSLEQGFSLVVFGLLFVAAIIMFMSLSFVRRIGELTMVTSAISNGEYNQLAPEWGRDEISQLAHHFNQMAETVRQRITALEDSRSEIVRLNTGLELRVVERTQALETANQALQKTIENLKYTQESLVRSEKLASLGFLVAGVAHELNTPLGNALLIATTLEERTQEFALNTKAGLKRSALEDYVALMISCSQMVASNLSRAADITNRFKNVAVDQARSKRRNFNLEQVIKEVGDSLGFTFRDTPYTLKIDIPKAIYLDSYPEPLGKVVSNLLSNALIHAFGGCEQGQMRLEARMEKPGWVTLEFIDDGNGIPPENLKRIFDPFFTTRFGQGGNGLGLNIVHNIVEGLLGGRMSVESEAGQGTCFIMQLPLVAPLSETS